MIDCKLLARLEHFCATTNAMADRFDIQPNDWNNQDYRHGYMQGFSIGFWRGFRNALDKLYDWDEDEG